MDQHGESAIGVPSEASIAGLIGQKRSRRLVSIRPFAAMLESSSDKLYGLAWSFADWLRLAHVGVLAPASPTRMLTEVRHRCGTGTATRGVTWAHPDLVKK